MTILFIAHAQPDVTCAGQLRIGLEARGYHIWQQPSTPSLESILYPQTIEQGILGSAAFILLWSNAACQSEWVERQTLFAQQLRKPILPIALDAQPLPDTLPIVPLYLQGSSAHTLPQLLPHLPAAQNSSPLQHIAEQAAHAYIRERKVAIDLAEGMLKRGEERETLLAILDYLAENDQINGVREKADEVRKRYDSKAQTISDTSPVDSHHVFGVRCKKGHISHFDKRLVCSARVQIPRNIVKRAEKEFDELRLNCTSCGEVVVARVDCGGYK